MIGFGGRIAGAALALGLSALLAPAAQAQASRTWVSGVGDDANPCSRTSPCRTFAGAISKTAARGQIDCLDAGGFGAVTIQKSISIVCDGVPGGVLAAGTNGIVVNAAATDVVVLRGLAINGGGTGFNGIRILLAKRVEVYDSSITAFTVAGILGAPGMGDVKLFVSNTTITANKTGISTAPTGTGLISAQIEDSQINSNADIGVSVAATNQPSSLVIRNSSVRNNVTGVSVSPAGSGAVSALIENSHIGGNIGGGSGVGIAYASANQAGTLVVRDSTVSHNDTGISIAKDGSGAASALIENSQIGSNGTAGIVYAATSQAGTLVIRNSSVSNNVAGISLTSAVAGGSIVATVEGTLVNGNSGNGINVSANTGSLKLTAVNSTVTSNNNGVTAVTFTGSALVSVMDSTVAYSTGAGVAVNGPGSQIWLSGNVITANAQANKIVSGSIYTYGDNRLFGNQTFVPMTPANKQ